MLARRMTRDLRLDVWRGLCLVDVVLVHLAYNDVGFPPAVDALIKDYTRFAAGGFVLLSGLTVGSVFGARLAAGPAERLAVYRILLRRAGVLVLVDLLSSVAFRVLDGARRFPVTDGAPIAEAVRRMVLLEQPGVTGGILFLYAVLLATLPAVLELRRRLGAGAVGVASLGLYVLAQASANAHWPANDFPVLCWQPLFVAGFLSSGWYVRTREAAPGRLAVWTAIAAGAFAAVFVLQHGTRLGLSPAVPAVLDLDFTKTPLRPGALLWYLAVVQLLLAATTLCWRHVLALRPLASFLALLGRHSLLVYVAHVFTEILVLEYVWGRWPQPALRMGAVAGDVVALAVLCFAVERGGLGRRRARRAPVGRGARVSTMLRPVAVAVLAAACVAAVAWWLPPRAARVAATPVVPADVDVLAVEAAEASAPDVIEVDERVDSSDARCLGAVLRHAGCADA
jgi:hypothetical protein